MVVEVEVVVVVAAAVVAAAAAAPVMVQELLLASAPLWLPYERESKVCSSVCTTVSDACTVAGRRRRLQLEQDDRVRESLLFPLDRRLAREVPVGKGAPASPRTETTNAGPPAAALLIVLSHLSPGLWIDGVTIH